MTATTLKFPIDETDYWEDVANGMLEAGWEGDGARAAIEYARARLDKIAHHVTFTYEVGTPSDQLFEQIKRLSAATTSPLILQIVALEYELWLLRRGRAPLGAALLQ